jgi:hypothetical protein
MFQQSTFGFQATDDEVLRFMATPKLARIQQARNDEVTGSGKINNLCAGFMERMVINRANRAAASWAKSTAGIA